MPHTYFDDTHFIKFNFFNILIISQSILYGSLLFFFSHIRLQREIYIQMQI